MKLDTARRNVEADGVQDTNQFAIEMNAASIDILSSKIYSNPMLAIVRELACNAWDAHIAAGTTATPFKVYFPNDLMNEFKIRDFGVGLSHDDVMYLYTTYFGSNKRDTNSMIGGLGLGSKTPYSYTNAFTVRSFFNGELRTYAAYKNEDGIPTISLVSTEETDEPNGVEVAVPVKTGDSRKFYDVAQRALQWFPTKPDVQGYDLKPVKWETKVPTCGMLKDSERYGSSQVVMGNVAYKLDLNVITKQHDLNRSTSSMAKGARFVLFAEIGELNIAASREELNYNTRTINRLAEMLAKANQDMVAHVAKGIEDEKTVSGKFYWRAKLPEEVRSMIQLDAKVPIPTELTARMVQRHTWSHETGIKTVQCSEVELQGTEHPAILVVENKTAAFKKIIDNEPDMHPQNKRVYRYGGNTASRDVYIIWKPEADDVKGQLAFSGFLGKFESDFIFWSSAYKAERQRPSKKAGTYMKPATRKRKLYRAGRLYGYSSKHNWSEIESALDELDLSKHVLVGYHANHCVDHDKEQESYGKNALDIANFLAEENEVVFLGVPRMAWKTAKKQGFLLLRQWIDEKLKIWVKKHALEDYIYTMKRNELAQEFPLLSRYVDHASEWEKHAPDSLARYLTESYKHLEGSLGSSIKTQIQWVEEYQGKSLFKVEMDEALKKLRKRMAGAEEWLRFSYPELTDVVLKSRWSRLDKVAGMYINCKEGLDCDEC